MKENNRLIAEFMGLTIITDGISLFDTSYKALRKYHRSWNSLMPVVEKIEMMLPEDVFITIEFRTCLIPVVGFENDGFDIETEGETKIEAVYNAVVEFIKWYNTTHVKTKPSV